MPFFLSGYALNPVRAGLVERPKQRARLGYSGYPVPPYGTSGSRMTPFCLPRRERPRRRAYARFVEAGRAAAVRFGREIPALDGIDHGFGRTASQEESRKTFGQAARFNTDVVTTLRDWVAKVDGQATRAQ